ncbi:MAG: phosphoribosylaminoimidazolesuccinocarboxamide synthase [Candidatus Krumholzibacteriia bacterium]
MRSLRSTSELGLRPDFRGKVREIFDLGHELLIVATDRISAYDVVMAEPVPGRGSVLSVMTLAWLARFPDVPNHLVTADPAAFPPPFRALRDELGGRSMLVRKAQRLPLECVARGYLAGSAFAAYRRTGAICGVTLPPGLALAQRLPEPIFTPSTKAEEGHDENIDFAAATALVGAGAAAAMRDLTLRLYREAAALAAPRGVIVADTKFEFGLVDGRLTLIDEVLTPDSSRFWPAAATRPGEDPPSWDKQILRNHLAASGWDREPPPPAVPPGILQQTAARYREVLALLFPEEVATWSRYLD